MKALGRAATISILVGACMAARAGAQTALVVGSVRDQHGAAVEEAVVTARTAAGAVASVATDAAGTFALRAANVTSVAVACRYCASTTVAVKPGEPVVVIVRRYAALLDAAPSDADLANLPYAHVENAMALRPFALLQQSSSPYPGPQLSDRGLMPSNALLVDASVPNYDAVLGLSPYPTIPASYERSGDVLPPSDAFLYGDQSGAGIVTLTPFAGDDADVALLGGDAIARVALGSPGNGVVAGSFTNFEESRQRADGEFTLPLSSTQTIALGGSMSQGREFQTSLSSGSLADSFGFTRAAFTDAEPSVDVDASFVADRGDYSADPYYAVADVWSDVTFTAGARTRGPIAGFLDVSSRLSTGTYGPSSGPAFGAAMTQDRVDGGVTADTKFLDATAGVGLFGFGFSGGPAGSSSLTYGHLATPSLAFTLFPEGKWSANLAASESFDLPTLWQQYGWDDDYTNLTYDRAKLFDATLTYSDNERLRVSAQAASQRVTGFTNGLVTSDGFSVAWQFAPTMSLRAWTMFVDNATSPSPESPGLPGIAPTVNAFWFTYENGDNMRIDAIYRRDLLNNLPFYHLDGDMSGPISPGLRWYTGVENRQGTQFINAGLRFSK